MIPNGRYASLGNGTDNAVAQAADTVEDGDSAVFTVRSLSRLNG